MILLLLQPYTPDEIYNFVRPKWKSPSSQLNVLTSISQSYKLLNITMPNKELWFLALRALRNITRELIRTPISFNATHCQRLLKFIKSKINSNETETRQALILALLFDRYMRPDDVARIQKDSIKLNSR